MPVRSFFSGRLCLLLWLLVLFCLPRPLAAAEKAAQSPTMAAMAGQMILAGFRGSGEEPLSEDLVFLLEDIRLGHVGGVILFDRDAMTGSKERNIISTAQVAALTARLQRDSPTPLFIGVDQEGGRVRRLKEEHGFAPAPSAKELGLKTPPESGAEAVKLGKALRALGINVNFAPCLDVSINPQSPAIGALERSFSQDAREVAAHGLAFAKGLYSQGVIPCYKHFPGHGSARDDTHLGVTDITGTWREEELIPYKFILGQSPPAMVMPGHIAHEKLSERLPASLSDKVIQGMLRRDLGWRGVVISDDLQMQAIEGQYSTKEALRMAVLAGADILLLGNNLRHDPQEARKAHALLMELVREGAISPERIKQSYERIITLKQQAGIIPEAKHGKP